MGHPVYSERLNKFHKNTVCVYFEIIGIAYNYNLIFF